VCVDYEAALTAIMEAFTLLTHHKHSVHAVAVTDGRVTENRGVAHSIGSHLQSYIQPALDYALVHIIFSATFVLRERDMCQLTEK